MPPDFENELKILPRTDFGLVKRLSDTPDGGSWVRSDPWTRVGEFAAACSLAELGLGSLAHTMHIPFSGHMMANLQGLMLGSFLNGDSRNARYVFPVAAISAGLKSLSPSGARFRPMLAILTQGLFYHAVVNVAGAGLIGLVLGQAVIGAWCSFQTFVFQYLLFGADLYKSYEFLLTWFGRWMGQAMPSPMVILQAWVMLNAILSALLALAARYSISLIRRQGHDENSVWIRLGGMAVNMLDRENASGATPWRESARASFKELTKKHFLIPLIFVLAFSWLGRGQWEHLCYLALRALLVAFACSLAARRIDFLGIVRWLRHRGWPGPALALETALAQIRHANR